ncbi:DoxX family protein [Ravibacter arvi]|uniref:DoxX family protein n=2 Tax=Ravibacter arvi TaxID=2051041 RepID=A0ABP8MCA0_9BACT
MNNQSTTHPSRLKPNYTMKIVSRIARFLVGIVFIFSGLIKLNDPVGTQIKLEEYFEVFAHDMAFLHGFFHAIVPFALYFAVFLCVAEVVLGVALLVRYRPRTTNFLLLLIIIFFSFLTFYSAYFNKVTDCGCFGDALKLTPWTSFTKDLILLVLIVIIIWYQRDIKPLPTAMVVAVATVGSLVLAFYAITHLPPLDLLPYRVGNSIPEQMKPSEPYQFEYIFLKDGKTHRFKEFPDDSTYVYQDMVTLNADKAKPKVTDYRVWNDTTDYTQESFKGNKLIVIVKNLKDINAAAFPTIKKLVDELAGSDIQPLIFTSAASNEIEDFLHAQQLSVPYYFADATVLKTISRSNPGIWLLSDGVVKGKWHYNDTPAAATVRKLVKP